MSSQCTSLRLRPFPLWSLLQNPAWQNQPTQILGGTEEGRRVAGAALSGSSHHQLPDTVPQPSPPDPEFL